MTGRAAGGAGQGKAYDIWCGSGAVQSDAKFKAVSAARQRAQGNGSGRGKYGVV